MQLVSHFIPTSRPRLFIIDSGSQLLVKYAAVLESSNIVEHQHEQYGDLVAALYVKKVHFTRKAGISVKEPSIYMSTQNT